MESAVQRRKAVQFGIALTRGTAIAPDQYERQLLAQYIRGVLTIEQVVQCLEERQPQAAG